MLIRKVVGHEYSNGPCLFDVSLFLIFLLMGASAHSFSSWTVKHLVDGGGGGHGERLR
jgi:hypothetical protein